MSGVSWNSKRVTRKTNSCARWFFYRESQVFATTSEMSVLCEFKRFYDWVEAETRKSQASFQIIQVSSEALPRMRLE